MIFEAVTTRCLIFRLAIFRAEGSGWGGGLRGGSASGFVFPLIYE